MNSQQVEQTSLRKLEPFDEHAEQAALGAVLFDNHALYALLEISGSEDFYKPRHQHILDAMIILNTSGEIIDLLTLRDELTRQKQIEKTGGAAYLAELCDAVPTAANIESHARIIHDKAVARRTLNASLISAAECYEDGYAGLELYDRATARLNEVGDRAIRTGLLPVSRILPDVEQQVTEVYEQQLPITGLPSGFPDLDALTSGFQASDVILLAARPSVGKTSLANQFALHAALVKQCAVAFFSVEMSKEKLVRRMVSQQARVDLNHIHEWQEAEWTRWANTSELLGHANIFVDDSAGLTNTELRAKAIRLHQTTPLGCVIVDYLQLMHCAIRKENRNLEVMEISRSLKELAKTLKVPVIALSQFSREVEKHGRRPQLSDLRDSGSLEQDADVVLFLHCENKEDAMRELIIGKQRNGPLGTVNLVFNASCTRFENFTGQQIPAANTRHEDVF